MNNIHSFNSETLSEPVKDFTLFIEENFKNIQDDSILSFAFPIDEINLVGKLNRFDQSFDDFLFYEKPEDNYSFIAFEQLIDLSYDGSEFQTLAQTLSELNLRLINNWSDYSFRNFPFITGGVKFDANKSSEEWNDFKPMHFFIPRVILLQNKNKVFLVYNFQPVFNTNIQNEIGKFKEILSSMMSADNLETGKEKYTIKSNGNKNNDLQNWKEMVIDATDNLNQDFKKVVLSRKISFSVTDNIDWVRSFKSLENEYPNCYLFVMKSKGSIFFGASPEKFIGVNSNEIEIDALAATTSETKSNYKLELMTEKNIKEHNYVIDFIKDALMNYTDRIDIDDKPRIKSFREVNHLYSKIKAEIKSKEKLPELIDSMFPTSAVCGLPKQDAMGIINKLEKFDRGLYAGLIGWMDLDLNCDFAVAIRSALYKNKKLYVYAGAGIVEESIPEDEFAETEFKLNTILNLFDEKSQS